MAPLTPGLDRRILGLSMSAFFGGRSEARLVRTVAPVLIADAVSMYPTVNVNLGTSRLLFAERTEVSDVTEECRQKLAGPDLLEQCFDRGFWRDFLNVTLVEVDFPGSGVWPLRAHYDPNAADPTLGFNPVRYHGRLWFMLPDVVASVLLSREVPNITSAIRLTGVGVQPGLNPVAFRGGRVIDPRTDDPFVVMVEERQRIRLDPTISEEERERRQLSLKITVNAVAYGLPARFDRRELADPVEVVVYGPDDNPLRVRTSTPEDPGPFCFPPIAASVTAGARLELAMLERLLRDAGTVPVFCDTDSTAIPSTVLGDWSCTTPQGPVRALRHAETEAILARFDSLNPYNRELVPSVWKVEHDSLSRPLGCYAMSAKCYALFRLEAHGRAALVYTTDDDGEGSALSDSEDFVAWSEHGLGQYLDPSADEFGRARRDGEGRRVFIREGWDWILRTARGEDPPSPTWSGKFALTRFTVSSPGVAAWFRGRDAQMPSENRMRPGSFGLLAHPTGLLAGTSARALPAAPYEANPARWFDLEWYDRRSGRRVAVISVDPSKEPDRSARSLEQGAVHVRTMADVLHAHIRRVERKSLAPDGGPVKPETTGVLLRRPVESSPALTRLVGKEGNKLLQRHRGEVLDPAEYRVDYGSRLDEFRALVMPALAALSTKEIAGKTGLSERQVQRLRSTAAAPHRSHRETLCRLAVAIAGDGLRTWGIPPPAQNDALLHRFLEESTRRSSARACACGCSRPLSGKRKWYGESCRKRAYRKTAMLR